MAIFFSIFDVLCIIGVDGSVSMATVRSLKYPTYWLLIHTLLLMDDQLFLGISAVISLFLSLHVCTMPSGCVLSAI